MKTKISLIIVLALSLCLIFVSSVLAKEVSTTEITQGDSYTLTEDIEIDRQLDLHKDNFVLDLNGHTITASENFYSSYDNDSHLINIGDDTHIYKNITIKNGTVKTTTKNKHGINIYRSENIVLENVKIDHTDAAKGAPLMINGSTVTVKDNLDLVLGDKSWYGINVAPKDGQEASLDFAKGSEVTVEGGNEVAIYIEKENKDKVTIEGAKEAGLDMNENGTFVQHEHVFADKWFADAKNHWKECECGEKDALATHKFKEVTENGSKYQVCTVCGYKTEPVAITETTEEAAEEKDDTPKTGVSTVALSAAGVMALVSLAGIAINRKK